MKIWINSCHAALEYDHAKIFLDLGHDVSGLFDVGSNQRPKIPGITDVDPPSEIHEKNKVRLLLARDMGHPDVVVVHQHGDFPERARAFAQQEINVVSVIFGQGSVEDHQRLAANAKELPNIWIAAYALKEFALYASMGVPYDRLRLVRFGKPRDEFNPADWIGDEAVCFIPCNSVHHRGGGCNWRALEWLMKTDLPIRIGGKDTEEIGGVGELAFDEYSEQLKHAQCYLHLGTIPAPYTLTLVEAACAGTPIVAMDNGSGLRGEGFGVPLCVDAEGAYAIINAILRDKRERLHSHHHSTMLADTAFSGETCRLQWASLLRDIKEVSNARNARDYEAGLGA